MLRGVPRDRPEEAPRGLAEAGRRFQKVASGDAGIKCSRRGQCFACFQDDRGPARSSNVSFCTFWEPSRWRHWKSSGFHDPQMTFANSELQPGPPKRSKNNPRTKQMQQLSASPSQLEAATAPDQCPADAIPLSSRARPRVVPRCSVGCPATAPKKPQDGSVKPGAGSKKSPAAVPGYCTNREQCFACFPDDLGPARGSNINLL